MPEEKLEKIGFYTIYKVTTKTKTIYKVDSGKTIFISRFKKKIVNPYRDVQEFTSLTKAKEYIKNKLSVHKKKKDVKLSKIPKSLYLVLIKEESTDKTFVKVGITSKRFLMRRFSKAYGYDGYVIESILRRIESPDSESLEAEIKDKLNKKRSIKKYRPILESFSGYSECFDFFNLNEIIEIFDDCVNKP